MISIKNRWISLIVMFLFCTYPPNKKANIPDNIRYKETDSTTNAIAYDKIMTVFGQQGSDAQLFDKAVGCYPFLWSQLKNNSYFDSAEGAKIWLNIGKNRILTGKAFRSKKDLDSLQSFLVELIKKDSPFIVRKLNNEELSIYWSLIPFDIEEPIYVLNSKSHKLVLHFLHSFVFQIEDLSKKYSIKPIPLDTMVDQLPDSRKENKGQ